MLVRTSERQMSFLFQESDPFFDIGFRILEQEQIDQMLPYKRRQQNGREKLIFQIEGKHIVRLMDVILELEENELVDILYEMIYLNKKIEENGFLRKECIWYKFDNIYYDREHKSIMTAILPITGEFRYADNADWYNYFGETVENIVSCLPGNKAAYMKDIISKLKSENVTIDEVVEKLEQIGGSLSGELTGETVHGQKAALRLLYSGNNARLEFLVGDNDFLIGRNAELADGVIAASLSRAVSRRHCLITKMNNKYFVQDLKSVNHTLVNGIMIPPYELMELANNDILSVADIEFRVITKTVDIESA